jgi:hypothetical protein
MSTVTRHEFRLVVDTEDHAGNFRYELGAFLTGQAGEIHRGAAEAASAWRDLPSGALVWLEEHTHLVVDERGYMCSSTLEATPGWQNDGYGNVSHGAGIPAFLSVGVTFYQEPSIDLVRMLHTRAKTFCADRKLTFVRTRLLAVEIVRTETETASFGAGE